MTFAIDCQNLVHTYPGKPPVEAVRGIDLEIERGECFGVLGPNGAGKTTAIEILEGLLEPTSGDVQVLGHRWSENGNAIRQQIGISLQETKLSEKLSVLETLTLFRSFYADGVDPEAVMRDVSLEEKANAWIKTLSGGQKQRLAVATALVGDPQLLFLDEPTTGLDPQSRRQLWDIIVNLRNHGRTVLMTTHYMEEAERLCDRVAIVDRGKVIALGSPDKLIAGIGGDHVIEFSVAGDVDSGWVDQCSTLSGVLAHQHQESAIRLTVSEPHVALPALIEHLRRSGRELISLTTRHASLEDVFVKVAGRTIEEAEEEVAA